MPEVSSTSLAQITGAEIMRVGTWNGTKFTPQDLEDIAAASSEMGYVPPLKVGHDDSIGARAWGWIKNLRIAGEKLIGDLMDIPDSLAAIIRERGYDQLSAEVYLDLERDGKKYRRALKAVALLGSEVPAVSGLKPLRELFVEWQGDNGVTVPSQSYSARALCFTTSLLEEGRTMPDKAQPEDKVAKAAAAPDSPLRGAYDPEFTALKQKADAQATELAEHKAKAEGQAAELAALKQQSEAQAAELNQQKKETAALQAKNREIALSAKLDAWRGPPAFRPFLEVLYRASAETPRTVKLSLEPGKPEEMSLESVTDKLADFIATKSSWMLKQLAVVGGTASYEGDQKAAEAEVEARISKLIGAQPSLSYQDAYKQVLNADPLLKQTYAGV